MMTQREMYHAERKITKAFLKYELRELSKVGTVVSVVLYDQAMRDG